MPNKNLAEHDASAGITITLASLASSTVGVGRQSDMIDNADNAQIIHLYLKVTVGTSPVAARNIYVFLIKGDGTIRSDGAGSSDAVWTRTNARLLAVIHVPAATSDVAYYGEAIVRNPGPEWGVGIVQDTNVNLNATAGNFDLNYVVENQELQ